MSKFEAGKTYTTRSIGDVNCIIEVTVAARTEKTVRTTEGKTLRIALDHDGGEFVRPWGNYSMCPLLRAGRVVVRYTYKNPWYRPDKSGGDPAVYSTEAKPVQVGKYQRFHRIKSHNQSANCYDYVLNGVCITQRCGAGLTEEFLDGYVAANDSEYRTDKTT